MKAVTALASVPTAILLAQLVTPALALPSPRELELLNAALQDEVATRTKAEDAIRELNAELERRVSERTAQLHAANADLHRQIAEKEKAEAELKESELRFRELADSMPNIVWTAQPDGFVDYCNRRWHEYTGEPESTGRDSSRLSALHPDDVERCSAAWQRALATGAPHLVEYRLLDRRSGQYHWHLERALAVRNANGAIARWYGTGTDIHELKTVQADLETARATLEERVEERTTQLASANDELEAFSYSVSHDLRTPLRAINGFARILAEEHAGELDAEGARYVQTIRTSGVQMGQLIDDLLAFSRLGREAMKITGIDSRELVDAAFATFAPALGDRRVDFVVADLPRCHGDLALLKQVWLNLLTNALKFTRERESTSIVVGAKRDGCGTVFFIRDNGVGFDMQFADKLFGVFQRLHLPEAYEGTGVGLALAQRIIHRHGGRIWAEAEENRGATFFFNLGEVSDD